MKQLAAAKSCLRKTTPLILAALVMLAFLTLPAAPPDNEADPSLSAVLNYAHEHGLQFGTQIVSTYGPLGFLIFPCFDPHAAELRMVVNVTLCYAAAAGLCLVALRLKVWWRCLLLAVFVWAAASIEHRTDLVIETAMFCWGLLCFVESGRRLILSAIAFAALASFAAPAKVSFFFIASLSVVLLACDLVARGRVRLAVGMAISFIAAFLFGWLVSGQKLAHLATFLMNGLAVAQGYNQALGWEGLQTVNHAGFVLALLVMAVVVIRSLTAFGCRNSAQPGAHSVFRRGLLLAWASFFTFSVWKHGFVRGDAYHAVFFLAFVPVLALALDILPCEKPAARRWALVLAVASCLLAGITLQFFFFPAPPKSLIQPFQAIQNNLRCLWSPGDYQRRMTAVIEANRKAAQLAKCREIIGRESVDLFGECQAFVLFNDLNYRPRPVFQSYSACNARLMGLNEQFYLSPAAPQFVLFELSAPDRKFPPLEDAWLLRDLLINYAPVAVEGRFLLLKTRATEPPRLTLLREGTVRPGQPIDLREHGPATLWLEISLEPSLTGQLRQFLYRPPVVRLAAWREPGRDQIVRRRAPASMLVAGFLASPLVLNNEDVLKLYQSEEANRPGAYSFELLPGEEHWWQEQVRFRLYKIENQFRAR